MTAEDIDDAMGWAPGTARRRRWRIPERGGLPFADAELAGVPLWFRSTIEAWRANGPPGATGTGHPDRGEQPVRALATEPTAEPPAVPLADLDLEVPAAPPAELEAGDPTDPPMPSRPAVLEPEVGSDRALPPEPLAGVDADPAAEDKGEDDKGEDDNGGEEPEFSGHDSGSTESVDDGPGPAASGEAPPDVMPEPGDGVRSGFDLQVGQRVLAHVHGRWREARVGHRDRTTVAVDYNLDATPLGGRRQRVGIDRIRLAQP